MKVFSHKPYCFVYSPPEIDYWCEVEVQFYFFPYKYPIDPELFIEGFFPRALQFHLCELHMCYESFGFLHSIVELVYPCTSEIVFYLLLVDNRSSHLVKQIVAACSS